MGAQQDAEVAAYMARLTTDQLIAGVKKGREALALLDAIEAIDQHVIADDIGTERHASKDYVTWMDGDTEYRRRQLRSAINDTLAELDRRGVSA